ncbi:MULTISPECIES: alpha/beta fold hydrolase [Maritimibacter]|uniref:Hydrolase, alpha/beta fold family protein n=1 Tax=Maritimibacter alkaliphilus HTCC2654 TaxID=314271 RepID=A3VMC5_9RHOB|nr:MULTISPECIES: alpha/beta fold hydrolase [Maritimibacter]EAQ10583.1 hydrolase, alpha/beta fold family protein [Rhodobacterales bacterium HTCC2654] [Maritimibacter alkaliphilus HTCC2654]MBL6429231.1 alpha/beta fold hydrolase [Maritimibacter sp.]TYP81746.1 pimeloyl-ACP methyl ester carboxylesterase [Maritimibacter alkaliphilus HTCC2654]
MKDAVLLVPGMMCDSRVFGPQIEALSRDHAVTVANVSKAHSIREMAADVLFQAPPRFALCGLSMGGIVAMEILRRVPERVTRLCLISTTPLTETPEQAVWREPQIVKAQAGKLEDAMNEALSPDNFAPGPNKAKTVELVHDMARKLGPDTFVRQSRALQRRPDGQKTLRTLRAPSLVLCGEHDKITPPKRHTFMAELIPYAELAIIDDAGHLPTLETPEKTNMALEAWLDLPMTLR